MAGTLEPGQRIIETKLAKQLGIGQPTVREALASLEDEGLVTRLPNRGCEVTRLDEDSIRQMFELRIILEVSAADLAVVRRDQWNPAVLESKLKALKAAARASDVEGYYQCDLEFHDAIWRYSGNSYLCSALTKIVVPLFAFASLRLIRDRRIDLQTQALDHERIAVAILKGKRSEARRTMKDILGEFQDETLRLACDTKA